MRGTDALCRGSIGLSPDGILLRENGRIVIPEPGGGVTTAAESARSPAGNIAASVAGDAGARGGVREA